MNLPEIHLPDFSNINFKAIPEFIKDHKIPVIAGTILVIGGIVGGTIWHNWYVADQKAKAEAAIDWSLQALTIDQLSGGNYYVKDGETYYKVAPGIMASTGDQITIPNYADPDHRMLMFFKDDEQIPTLYKDSKLIYKAADFNNPSTDGSVPATPTVYYLERFSDQGYSLGLCRLENPDGTKYKTTIDYTHFYPGSSAANMWYKSFKNPTNLVIDKIQGSPLSADNVSPSGTILGLKHGESYTVDAYIGTSPVGGQVVADTHMFTSFELYSIKDYELDASGYAIVTLPEDMWSGYYYINGMGLFRYINGYKAYGVPAGLDYNTPYFMGKDQAGNVITNPAPLPDDPNATLTTTKEQQTEAVQDTGDPFTYHYKVTVDNQQRSMNISIDYTEAMTYSDTDGDGKYEILKASDGVLIPGASVPSAILTSPSGKTYVMTNMGAVADDSATSLYDPNAQIDASTQMKTQTANSLTATIENPEIGTWTVDLSGIYARAFTINTTYTGTSTNMVIKDTSEETSMTVYIPEELNNAVFKFTWEKLGHTGIFTVISPNGSEITSNARDNGKNYRYPDSVLLEQYGEVDLLVGKASAGEYKIKITGESLGHVYWNCVDLSGGNSEAVVATEEEPAEETGEIVKEEEPVKEEPVVEEPKPEESAENQIHEK